MEEEQHRPLPIWEPFRNAMELKWGVCASRDKAARCSAKVGDARARIPDLGLGHCSSAVWAVAPHRESTHVAAICAGADRPPAIARLGRAPSLTGFGRVWSLARVVGCVCRVYLWRRWLWQVWCTKGAPLSEAR
jgi:hypothetical protein